MAENVGSIFYDVTLETAGLVEGQRRVDQQTKKVTDSLNTAGTAAEKAGQKFTATGVGLRTTGAEFGKTGSAAQAAGSSFRGAATEAEGLNTRLNALAVAVRVLAAAYAVMKAAQLADDIRLMSARVDVAADSAEAGGAAMARLVAISRDTQTAVSANVEVFTRLNQSLLQMGGTQNDTLRITELLGKAIKVSGASAVEAKAAMLQFGQALGSGKLQGDELKSLMETAPYLMKKLADGIGVPVGALKKMGEEGKLTADVVVNALSKAASKIEADFEKFPQTVAGALQVTSDAAGRANEKLDTLTGSSAALTGIAKGTGEMFDELATQFENATTESDKLGRNDSIQNWATTAKTFLSYVVDAADLVWQTLSVLGRNVAFVFQSIGAEIGGIGAQVKAVMSGDFAGAKAIGQAMVADSAGRRATLDAADAKTLSGAKLAGQKMRDAWEAGAGKPKAVETGKPSNLRAAGGGDDKEAGKFAARAEAAKAYYEGLVAENSFAIDKIDAQERKALAENAKRAATDKENAEIYAKAKIEIQKKFARERALVEEKNVQGIADLNIATTIDETQKVERIRDEAIRRANVAEKTGSATPEEAARARKLATFQADKALGELADRNDQARAEAAILLTQSEEGRILLIRDEAIRQAEAAYQRGATTFEEAETKKLAAAREAIAQQKQLESSRASTVISTLQVRSEAGGVQDKVALIMAQAAAELAANQQAWAKDLEASQIYADKKAAIEIDMHRRIAETRDAANQLALTSTSDAFGSIANVLKRADGEQSGIYQAMFAAQKAFAIASSIVAIQTGIAKAASQPFPENIAAMASVAAATASIISTISGTSYGGARQYGGPTQAGSLYRVNETGAPEMFTASNGNQFMLGGSSGNVTPADSIGGGGLVFAPTYHIDGTADKAAALAQMQRVAGESNKQMIEQLKRMKVLPQG
ncbi:tape measure protein [Comamonadaceae bacterium OTU4NAUVB1]|nr:tape measure protein [Comamonadaceae bacterium OTU4NAUVB1]